MTTATKAKAPDLSSPQDTMPDRELATPHKVGYAAHFFVVLDSQGKERICMACADDGTPYIIMRDNEGKPRLKFQVGILGVQPQYCQDPTITLYDGNGNPRATAAINSAGAPVLFFEDEKGNTLWHSPPLDQFPGKKPRKRK